VDRASGGVIGPARVGRRRVFYIPGFDPLPPRRYRELYRSEAAAQSAVAGHRIEVRRSAAVPDGWEAEAEIEGAHTRTTFEVLVWSDIVRRAMGRGVLATYAQLARTAWIYGSTGALWRLLRLSRGATLATLYPVAVLLLGLAAAALAGRAAALAAVRLAPGGWAAPAAILAAAGGGYGLLWLLLRLDHRHYAVYLLEDYAHAASARGAWPAELAGRIGAFRDRVLAALAQGCDEVLIVGHSSGAHLAVAVMAGVLRARPAGAGGPALSLLTLGQAIPMMSFLPGASGLRGDLRFLSERDDIAWVDVSAPGDGCTYALCDPVAVSGVATTGKRWPLVLSAAFSQSLSPERLAALRWRFFRLHFQYLCAFDRPQGYDYFAITAGPLTLHRRFEGRRPSPQRVETPLSPYRSVA